MIVPFDKSAHDFWEDDVGKLRFGVETEHFLCRSGLPASLDDMSGLFRSLAQNGLTLPHDDPKSRFSVAVRSRHGLTVIKSECCSHILELEFPPLHRFEQFAEIWSDVWKLLHNSLFEVLLAIRPGSVLDPPLQGITFCAGPSGRARLDRVNRREMTFGRFGHRHCFALIAATHIHLNVLNARVFETLPGLYAWEYLVPLLFSAGTKFGGNSAHSIRPLIFRDSFDDTFEAVGIPPRIPNTEASYRQMVDTGRGMFRDYSFICPSTHNTLEFRSADALDQLDRIEELVALRFAAVVAEKAGIKAAPRDARSIYYQVCENGEVPMAVAEEDACCLLRTVPHLPDWVAAATTGLVERLRLSLPSDRCSLC